MLRAEPYISGAAPPEDAVVSIMVEEKPVPVIYDDVKMECGFRADLIVNAEVVVELKAKTTIHPVDKAQTLSHLRLLGLRVGLLINFHEEKLVGGVSRIINGY